MRAFRVPVVVVLVSSITFCSLSTKSCSVKTGDFCWGVVVSDGVVVLFCNASFFALSRKDLRRSVAGVLFALFKVLVLLLFSFLSLVSVCCLFGATRGAIVASLTLAHLKSSIFV